ncbi:hypothetical protein BH20VER2_BH20VER2_07350 [soil metagenome]
MASAVARKTHGAAGDFDVELPLTGDPGVECRSVNSAGLHTIVISFNNAVTEADASVSAGNISGVPTFSGKTMTVNLSGVPNAQQITVSLSNVKDGFAQVLPTASVSMNVLAGDTNGNKAVNATDISQTKSQSGHAASAENFRADLNADGSISASDISLVKAASGSFVP